MPLIPEGFYSSFDQYTLKLKDKEQRDVLQAYLKKQGIPSAVYYLKPMHWQDAFSHLQFDEQEFTLTNELCDIVLSLPMHPYLQEADLDLVCDAIKAYIT